MAQHVRRLATEAGPVVSERIEGMPAQIGDEIIKRLRFVLAYGENTVSWPRIS
jgi:hypothetical protein